jgi:hypothetical protein
MSPLPLLALVFAGTPPASDLRIEPGPRATSVRVVAKLPADTARLPQGKLTQEQGEAWLKLALIDDETGKAGVAMFGSYERRGDQLLFTPRHSLLHAHRYRASFGPAKGKTITAEYRVPPRPAAPAPVVEKVYPTADVLPANHLRFHIRFSRPMRGGKEIFQHIRILDAKGKEVVSPWLPDELWADDDRSLILYIHPGRIKWGLLLRMLLGPVLEPGRDYTLVIGTEVCDIDGRPLTRAFTKKFRTTAEDRTRINLSAWKLQAPTAGTRAPLVLAFPTSLDRLGLERRLKVLDSEGKEVGGRTEVGAGERSWAFHPASPWKVAAYRVEVDRELEDVAGNTPVRAFDVDLTVPAPPPQSLSLRFQPAPAAPAQGAASGGKASK